MSSMLGRVKKGAFMDDLLVIEMSFEKFLW